MAWTLTIQHIDVLGEGDATLIVARDGSTVRSALIDGGGSAEAAGVVHQCCLDEKLQQLDVMVATHYDTDHINGLKTLLKSDQSMYAKVAVYDRGEPGMYFSALDCWWQDNQYLLYSQAVGKSRNRMTRKVAADYGAPGQLAPPNGYQASGWLVGQEILWCGGQVPAGAPALVCVAANQWVLQQGNPNRYCPTSLLKESNPNAQSLAFLLEFGNFRYYVGGDLEQPQEDALIQHIPNPVQVMKASHHGSKESTSTAFLNWLTPDAVIVSCGTDNRYGHPPQTLVDRLQRNNVYLTGESLGDGPNLHSPDQEVAGVWPPRTPFPNKLGSVRVYLSQADAGQTRPAFDLSFYRPKAGTNYNKANDFSYLPSTYQTWEFNRGPA